MLQNAAESAKDAFDRKAALARVDGDENLLADLAKLFLEEGPKMLAAIQTAVSEKDAARLERAAHSIKGTVSTFAAQGAFDAALKLERLGRAGELQEVSQALMHLESEMDRLQSALQSLVAAGEQVPHG